MSRLDQLIGEIRELKNETNHRAALRILQVLENNKKLFSEKIEEDYLQLAIRNFETLCDTPSRDYHSASYIRDFQKYYESLMFHLDKVF